MSNLKTVQVDYILVFKQVPVENNTFIEMPWMFEVLKNFYGLCEAHGNFFIHLKKGLNDHGLESASNIYCLFYDEHIIV
jgi:hypothetical protein